jgi:zinc transporter ZupT
VNFVVLCGDPVFSFPEGVVIGTAFAGAATGTAGLTITGAWTLALAVGLQDMPEGACVSLPLFGQGMSKRRAFFYGQLSGMVEPIAALLGAALVSVMTVLLPWSLGFAGESLSCVVIARSCVVVARPAWSSLVPAWSSLVLRRHALCCYGG